MSVDTEPVMEQSDGELRDRVRGLRLADQLAGAKKGGGGATWLPWALAAGLALTWAGVGIRGYRAPADDNAAVLPVTSDAPVANSTATPTTENKPAAGAIQLEVKGYLIPATQVAVSPIDVAGQLIELNVVEGEYYEKGAVLARIDPASYQYTVAEARQMLVAAKAKLDANRERRNELKPENVRQIEKDSAAAQLAEAEAQLSRANDQLKRMEATKFSVTQSEYDTARNDFLAAKARAERFVADLKIIEKGPRPQRLAAADADVEQAAAEVKSAEARLASAEWRLDNCTIRAPISGTALTKKSEKGNLVNPLAFAGGTGSVCEMADLAGIEVEVKIPERDISKLKVGQSCRVRPDAYPDKIYPGTLDRIMPIAVRAESIVNVRVKVQLPAGEKPGTYLKPEMGAIVSFLAPAS